MGVQERVSRPPTSGVTPHACQTKVPRKRDNYGERCMPHRKRNMTPRSFPVKDSPAGEAFPRCQLASFSGDEECDKPLPRCLQARIHQGSFSQNTFWVLPPDGLGAALRGSRSHKQHTLGLPASAPSDKESYKQNPELCSINRTAKSQRPCRV